MNVSFLSRFIVCMLMLLVSGCSSHVNGNPLTFPTPEPPNTLNTRFFGQHFFRLFPGINYVCTASNVGVSGVPGFPSDPNNTGSCDSLPTVYPEARSDGAPMVGVVRDWDSGGISWWSHIETSRGVYFWNDLDQYVALASANGSEFIHNLGVTPSWASARPNEWYYYTSGGAAEPANFQDWRDYLTALFTRYKGKIKYYEVWNEPTFTFAENCTSLYSGSNPTPEINCIQALNSGQPTFYTGTAANLWELQKEAYTLLHQIDPAAKLLSPPFFGPPTLHGDGLGAYLDVAGSAFAQYTDLVAFHAYTYTPEQIVPIVRDVQVVLKGHGISGIPIISTEAGIFNIDYNLWPAYLSRSYIMGLYAGLQSFIYYGWDYGQDAASDPSESPTNSAGFASTPGTGQLLPGGIAMNQLETWLMGATLGNCLNIGNSIVACDLVRSSAGTAKVVWSSNDQTNWLTIPSNWPSMSLLNTLEGGQITLNGALQTSRQNTGTLTYVGNLVSVSAEPILFRETSSPWVYSVGDPVSSSTPSPTTCEISGVGAYQEQVIADGPLAYYTFDQNISGTTVLDSSGNSNNGLLVNQNGSVVYAEGAIVNASRGSLGTSLRFANNAPKNNYYQVQAPTTVNPWSGDWSIEYWVRMNDNPPYVDTWDYPYAPNASPSPIYTCIPDSLGNICQNPIPGQVNAISLGSYSVNGFRIGLDYDNPYLGFSLWTTQSVPGGSTGMIARNQGLNSNGFQAGVWNHIVFTYDKGANLLSSFRNGLLISSTTSGTFVPPVSGSDAQLLIGSLFYQFTGDLDEVAIYAKTLSPSNILLHYQMGSGVCAGGPL